MVTGFKVDSLKDRRRVQVHLENPETFLYSHKSLDFRKCHSSDSPKRMSPPIRVPVFQGRRIVETSRVPLLFIYLSTSLSQIVL